MIQTSVSSLVYLMRSWLWGSKPLDSFYLSYLEDSLVGIEEVVEDGGGIGLMEKATTA